jgi:chaperonin GroEL (HSP60 family)
MMQDNAMSHQSLVSADGREDVDTQESNFRAGEQLAETVRTTLGPKGLDKLLISSDGKLIVTNDGASILDRLNIEHPAANLIVEVAEQQDTRAGDGTTSAVILAGELLGGARALREQGIHPTKITEGYHLAATHIKETLPELTVPIDTSDDDELEDVARTVITGKWDTAGTEFLAERAVQAVRAIQGDDRVAFEKITRKTIPGGSFYDSELIEGLVIDMAESSADVVSPVEQLPSSYTDATVALVDQELSTDEPTGIGAVDPDSYEDYEAFREYEQDVYDQYVETLIDVGTDVLFCQQSIDDPVRYQLATEGILAVERTRRDELNKLARATGAQAVTMDQLSPATVGRATSVERRSVGPTEVTIVSGFDRFDQISLLFRGGTERIAAETKRKLDDCFYVLKLAIEDQALLPGGGATEVALAQALRTEAIRHPGKEQLAIEAFADALEAVPRTLAQSAGMNPVDALIELRNAHSAGTATAGLNLDTAAVDDMATLGVLEPLHVKRQAITSAAEATNMIVRVDDTLSVSGHDHEGHDHEEDHDHGPGGVVQSSDGYPWAVGHSMGHDH